MKLASSFVIAIGALLCTLSLAWAGDPDPMGAPPLELPPEATASVPSETPGGGGPTQVPTEVPGGPGQPGDPGPTATTGSGTATATRTAGPGTATLTPGAGTGTPGAGAQTAGTPGQGSGAGQQTVLTGVNALPRTGTEGRTEGPGLAGLALGGFLMIFGASRLISAAPVVRDRS